MNAKARQRAEVIFQVRSGQMTATQGAQLLGISRQQYYQWEQRALQALLSAVENQPTGRPKSPTDPEKQALQRRVEQLEQEGGLRSGASSPIQTLSHLRRFGT